MASIPGVRFDITGASGTQNLLSPKQSWRAYVFPRGGYASQDSTGTLYTFDSASVASRFAVNDWTQAGLSTDNIRQVSAVGGNSISVSGANVTVTTNDRIYLVGQTQPTVSGGSATYTVPATIIRQRDDDTATIFTNSQITSNSDGLIQFFSDPALYDSIIQDGNQANQGSIIDLPVGAVEGVSTEFPSVFGSTVTIQGNLVMVATDIQDFRRFGPASSATTGGAVRYADGFTTGSSTGGVQEAIDDLPSTGGIVIAGPITYTSTTQTITISGNDVVLQGSGWGTIITTDNATGFDLITITGDRCEVRDLKVLSSRTRTVGRGIFSTGDDTRVVNIFCQDTPDNSIMFQNNTRCTAERCRIIDPGDTGSVSAQSILFSTSTFGKALNNYCQGTNSQSTGSAGQGQIYFFSASNDGIATGNHVVNTENGVRCDSDRCDIGNNQITTSSGEGIRATGDDIDVIGNLCRGNTGSGIASLGGNRINIVGNICISNANKGIQIVDTTESINDSLIANNICKSNTGDGIQISTGTTAVNRVSIKGNLCASSAASGNGVVVTASGAATLTDVVIDSNTVTGNSADGININGTAATFTRCAITNNSTLGNQDDGISVGDAGAASTISVENNFSLGNSNAQHRLSSTNWTYSGKAHQNLDIPTAATITVTGDGFYAITGVTNITSVTAAPLGTHIFLRFASTPTVTDGSNLRMAGDFVATANDMLELICDGTNWFEVSRSAN